MWYSLFSSIFVILPHVSLLSVQLLTERLTGQATSIIKEHPNMQCSSHSNSNSSLTERYRMRYTLYNNSSMLYNIT